LDALPPAQRALWPNLADLPPDFVLYGGTAVALRCGHRISEDFDFFTARAFAPEALLERLPWLARPRVLQRQSDTFTVEVLSGADPVKFFFFGSIAFGQIRPPDRATSNGLKIASAEDLLALKLGVIQQRIEAKDYLDIHALLQAGLSLAEGLGHLDALHPLTTNWVVTLKTLVYFQGGDLGSLSERVKSDLEAAVRNVREVPPFAGVTSPIGSGA
jgi:Nucleotidyl transferase AbiEii toxin, Type IV TA system